MMLYNEDQIIEMLYRGYFDEDVEEQIVDGRFDEAVLERAKTATKIYLEIVDKLHPVSS
jgi:hypothetical protein